MPDAPSATPRAKPPSNLGCVLALVALPFVVLVGLVVGLLLRGGDDGPTEASSTLDEGEIDGVEWRIDAQRDVEGESCVFSFLDGAQSTGACTLDPQDETIGTETIVFGRAEPDQEEVRVQLDDGQVVDVETTTVDAVPGRFYVTVVDRDVDAESLVP